MKYIKYITVITSAAVLAVYIESMAVTILIISLSLLVLLGLCVLIAYINDKQESRRFAAMVERARIPRKGFRVTCDGKESA